MKRPRNCLTNLLSERHEKNQETDNIWLFKDVN